MPDTDDPGTAQLRTGDCGDPVSSDSEEKLKEKLELRKRKFKEKRKELRTMFARHKKLRDRDILIDLDRFYKKKIGLWWRRTFKDRKFTLDNLSSKLSCTWYKTTAHLMGPSHFSVSQTVDLQRTMLSPDPHRTSYSVKQCGSPDFMTPFGAILINLTNLPDQEVIIIDVDKATITFQVQVPREDPFQFEKLLEALKKQGLEPSTVIVSPETDKLVPDKKFDMGPLLPSELAKSLETSLEFLFLPQPEQDPQNLAMIPFSRDETKKRKVSKNECYTANITINLPQKDPKEGENSQKKKEMEESTSEQQEVEECAKKFWRDYSTLFMRDWKQQPPTEKEEEDPFCKEMLTMWEQVDLTGTGGVSLIRPVIPDLDVREIYYYDTKVPTTNVGGLELVVDQKYWPTMEVLRNFCKKCKLRVPSTMTKDRLIKLILSQYTKPNKDHEAFLSFARKNIMPKFQKCMIEQFTPQIKAFKKAKDLYECVRTKEWYKLQGIQNGKEGEKDDNQIESEESDTDSDSSWVPSGAEEEEQETSGEKEKRKNKKPLEQKTRSKITTIDLIHVSDEEEAKFSGGEDSDVDEDLSDEPGSDAITDQSSYESDSDKSVDWQNT